MKSLWEERTARISEARLNSKAIGEELKELREWMRDPEGRLGRPVSVHDTSEKEFKKKRKEYQVSQMLSVGFVQPRILAWCPICLWTWVGLTLIWVFHHLT